jgi:hypothetical protein
MGFSAGEIDRMEPYQFAAQWRGWSEVHAPPKTQAPTAEEFRRAVARTMH